MTKVEAAQAKRERKQSRRRDLLAAGRARQAQKVRWAEATARVRESLLARLADKEHNPVEPPPIYDDVFFSGVDWLDSL